VGFKETSLLLEQLIYLPDSSHLIKQSTQNHASPHLRPIPQRSRTRKPQREALRRATAACAIALGREYDHKKDFLHAQGDAFKENARCHVLLDCDYHDSTPDLATVPLRCFRMAKGENGL